MVHAGGQEEGPGGRSSRSGKSGKPTRADVQKYSEFFFPNTVTLLAKLWISCGDLQGQIKKASDWPKAAVAVVGRGKDRLSSISTRGQAATPLPPLPPPPPSYVLPPGAQSPLPGRLVGRSVVFRPTGTRRSSSRV